MQIAFQKRGNDWLVGVTMLDIIHLVVVISTNTSTEEERIITNKMIRKS